MARLATLALTSIALTWTIRNLAPFSWLPKSYLLTAFTFLLLQFSFVILWNWILRPKIFSPLRSLPQPKGGSFFMGFFWRSMKEPAGELLRTWVEEVPNNGLILYHDIFNLERIAVVSPAALSEVLVQKCYDFEKPPQLRKGISRILGLGLFLAEGDVHKKQRKDLMPAFHFRHVKELYPIFWAKARELVQRVTTEATASATSHVDHTTTVEVNSWASRAALDIIGIAGMGKDFCSLADPNSTLNQTYRKIFSPGRAGQILGLLGFFLPVWVVRKIPFKRNQDISEASEVVKSVCRSLIQGKREKLEKGGVDRDIISVALESGGFSDEGLVNQMMTFLVAGHETGASSFVWSVYLLCKHQKIQECLRAEIRQHLPNPFNDESTITSSDVDGLVYLNAICNEALRLFPPVALTVREAVRDTTILDQMIPKGTSIIIAPWATNASKALWGPNAADFDPSRWIGTGKANAGGAESNYSFLTFLHGPRSCIGQAFAKAELACLLAAWVGTFETTLSDPAFVPEIRGGISAKPRGGLHVIVKRVEWQ